VNKYSIELAVAIEVVATDTDEATKSAEKFMAELKDFIRNSDYQGWINLIEVVELESELIGNE
jgi:hypothetical protein